MECEDPRLLGEWAESWRDLVEFEFVPVVAPEAAAEAVSALLRTFPDGR
jgi:hypothetical protein